MKTSKVIGVILLCVYMSLIRCAIQVEGQLLPELLLILCAFWIANITIDILYFGKQLEDA